MKKKIIIRANIIQPSKKLQALLQETDELISFFLKVLIPLKRKKLNSYK